MSGFQSSRRIMASITLCLVVILSSTAIAVGQSEAGHDATLAERLTTLAKPYVDHELVIGMSIGVIQRDETATLHLGLANDRGQAPSDDTVYEIASISKVFTGILLADAVTQGRVRLDEPAQDLLPNSVIMPSRNGELITLLQLATHRSGLPRLADNMPSLQSENPYADFTASMAHQFLNKYQLQRSPGEEHEYSNLGFGLLGNLISEQAKLSYEELLQQRLTLPLGMLETRVTLTPAMQERMATPHKLGGEVTSTWEFADMPGAGGIRSSIRDMLRFAEANMDPPPSDLGNAMNLAWKKHQDADPPEFAMGLGWHIALDGSTRWHNGQTGGFHSMLMVNREARLAVVILSNSAVMEIDRLAGDVIQMLAGEKVMPRQFEATVHVAPEKMKRLEGRYQLAPNFVFTVKIEDDKLMVGVTNQPTLQVFPQSDTQWYYKAVEASLTFNANENGVFDSLELFQNGVRQTAKRIE